MYRVAFFPSGSSPAVSTFPPGKVHLTRTQQPILGKGTFRSYACESSWPFTKSIFAFVSCTHRSGMACFVAKAYQPV
jgi:hypothetical protein